MKQQPLIFLTACLLLACSGNPVRESIPGSYVSSTTGTFGQSTDTLIIEHEEDLHFLIERRTQWRALQNGQWQTPQFKVKREEWLYDRSTHSLNAESGRQISFYPKKHLLMLGKRTFQKIK